ncbi:MAG: hypothetical protein ACLSFT_07755 [Ruminococcus callidus]
MLTASLDETIRSGEMLRLVEIEVRKSGGPLKISARGLTAKKTASEIEKSAAQMFHDPKSDGLILIGKCSKRTESLKR